VWAEVQALAADRLPIDSAPQADGESL